MSDTPKGKFGPTKGEYKFRAVSGAVILVLVSYALFAQGLPSGLVASESILFGTLFGAFLLLHSSWKLIRRDYRQA